MYLNRAGCCTTMFVIYFAISAAIFINGNIAAGKPAPNPEREKPDRFNNGWNPDHEELYEETLDHVLECIYANKDKISKLIMTVIKVRPLLKHICKYNPDCVDLDKLIEPEILEIIEKAAKEKERKHWNEENTKMNHNRLIYKLINEYCSNKHELGLGGSEHDHHMDSTDVEPVYVKSPEYSSETQPPKHDHNASARDDNGSSYRNPCKDCKVSSFTDMINILNESNNCHRNDGKCTSKRNNIQQSAATNVNILVHQDSGAKDEEPIVKDDETLTTPTATDDCSQSTDEPCSDEKQKSKPTEEDDDKTKNDVTPLEGIIMEEPIHETQEKILPEKNDGLFRLLCGQPGCNGNLIPPDIQRSYPQLTTAYLANPFSCITDGRYFLRDTDPLIANNDGCKSGQHDHCPHQMDPNLYPWMVPSYQKCTYFKNSCTYETPFGAYNINTCNRKCDLQEGFI